MTQNTFDFWQFNNMSSIKPKLPTSGVPIKLNFWAPMSWATNFQTYIAPKVTMPWQQATSSVPNFLTQNVKQQPTPSFKIPWIEQANAQEPDVIQQYLDDENEDYNNRQQIFKMIENWEDTDFIKNSIVNTIWYTWPQSTQEQPWFVWWVKESITNRLSNIWEWIVRPQQRPETISQNPFVASLQPLWSAIWQVGQVAGAVWDVGFEVLKWLWRWVNYISWWTIWQALEWWAKKLWNSLTPETQQTAINAIQQWWEIYSNFKKENPYIADTLEWSANIASLLPIGKAWQVWLKAGEKVLSSKVWQVTWKAIGKALELPWKATKKAWEALYKTAIKPNVNEAEMLLRAKAWLSKTPITRADTALKYWIAWTETWLWVQWLKKASNIFKETIWPALEKSNITHNIDDLFKKTEDIIMQEKSALRKQDLIEWLNALKDDYLKTWKNIFTSADLQAEKSALDEFTPSKIFQWKEVSNWYNQVKNTFANTLRGQVREDLWKTWVTNAKELYRDYANLTELSKIWIKWLTEWGLKWWFGTFWSTLYDKLATPIKTVWWKILYKTWDWLEFIWPKWIKKVWDFLKINKIDITDWNIIKKNSNDIINNKILLGSTTAWVAMNPLSKNK